MPTVPLATPQVQSRGIGIVPQSATGATAEAFGTAQGRALQQGAAKLDQFGDELQRAAIIQQREDNDREAKNLDIEFSSTIRSLTYGDGTDDNPGYYSKKGENALSGAKGVQEAIAKARQDTLDKASNPRIRALLSTVLAARESDEVAKINHYAQRERITANTATAEARIGEAAFDAANSWNDPKVIGRSLGVVRGEVDTMAQQNGWSPEVREAKLREARGMVVGSAVKQALASEDFETAQKVFNQYKDSIGSAAKIEITNALRTQAVTVQAQALRDKALVLFPNDIEKATKWITDNANGKLEDAALEKVLKQFSIKNMVEAEQRQVAAQARELARFNHWQAETARTEKVRASKRDAWSFIEGGGDPGKIDPLLKEDLDGTTLTAMFTRAAHLASGKPIATDFGRFQKITRMGPEELQDIDLGLERTRLAEPEFRRVEALVTAAAQGKKDPNNPFSDTQIINRVADELGLTGKDKQEDRGRLISMFMQRMEEAEKSNGSKRVTTEERQKIIDELTTQTVQSQNWFQKNITGGSTETKTYKLKIEEVPVASRTKIEAELRKWGRPVTVQNIVESYQKMKQQEQGSK